MSAISAMVDCGGSGYSVKPVLDRDESGALVVDLDGLWFTPDGAHDLAQALLALADEAKAEDRS